MDCLFLIDVTFLAIALGSPWNLVGELSRYFKMVRTIPEAAVKRPIMPNKFGRRTYFHRKGFGKMFLIHQKIDALKGMDALLVVHDITFQAFQKMGWLLRTLQSVRDYHLTKLELRWDFYPKTPTTAEELQRRIIKTLHLKNTRKAYYKGHPPRITYYIGHRVGDIFLKVYIRPKTPSDKQREFVRVEATVNRRWMKGKGLQVPNDFRDVDFDDLTARLCWLDLNTEEIRPSWLNYVTNGQFLRMVRAHQYEFGIAPTIIKYRTMRACPERCPHRMDRRLCPLAFERGCTDSDAPWEEIQQCQYSREIKDFERRFCKPYADREAIVDIMREAFERWRSHEGHTPPESLVPGSGLLAPLPPGSVDKNKKIRDASD